jgi:hypothetical protein
MAVRAKLASIGPRTHIRGNSLDCFASDVGDDGCNLNRLLRKALDTMAFPSLFGSREMQVPEIDEGDAIVRVITCGI